MRNGLLRLRSVRMKSGGAFVRVIPNEMSATLTRYFRQDARAIANKRASDLAGYAIVAWSLDGSTSAQMFIGEGRVVPRFSAVEFVKNALTDHLISSSISGPMDDGEPAS